MDLAIDDDLGPERFFDHGRVLDVYLRGNRVDAGRIGPHRRWGQIRNADIAAAEDKSDGRQQAQEPVSLGGLGCESIHNSES